MPANKSLSRLKTILKSKKSSAEKVALVTELTPELPDEAIGVMDDALADADLLLQVGIMDAYFEMTGDNYHEQDLEDILSKAKSMGDDGEEIYMAARVALGRINSLSMDSLDEWGDGQIDITATAQRRRASGRRRPVVSDSITIIIHGTFASNGKWWRPGGDFFEYVKKDLSRSDLYGQTDQFKWSGKNRDRKRRQAATALQSWLKGHPAKEVNIFAHSHGANIAMLSTHKNIYIDRLIMLSPPVRSDYFAKWSNVGIAHNIQASFDPVVAIARGGQWFNLRQVNETKLKASGHSSSHDPDVWRREKLANVVGIPWS